MHTRYVDVVVALALFSSTVCVFRPRSQRCSYEITDKVGFDMWIKLLLMKNCKYVLNHENWIELAKYLSAQYIYK